MKAVGLLLAMSLLALWGAQTARAADEQNSDSLTITITPTTDLGVDVDTTTTRFTLTDTPGTMALTMQLNDKAYFVSPATVTILGNYNNQEVQLSAVALNSWTVDTDEVDEADQVQLYALFAADKGAHPTDADFDQGTDGRHQVKGAAKMAGETVVGVENNDLTGNQFEIADASMAQGTDMDNLAVGAVKQLWLRVNTPLTSTTEEAVSVTITLTAMTGKTN
jgi:hypothetical protein